MGSLAILLLLFKNMAWIVVVWTFVGTGMAGIDVSANPELAELADKRHPNSYGKIYALSSTGTGLGFILGPLVSTSLLPSLGFQRTWSILGICLLCYVPVVLVVYFFKGWCNKGVSEGEESLVVVEST